MGACHNIDPVEDRAQGRVPRTPDDAFEYTGMSGEIFRDDHTGKDAFEWARLSCRKFRGNAVRIQRPAPACRLANIMRKLALPKEVECMPESELPRETGTMKNGQEKSPTTGKFRSLIFLFIPVFALLSSFLGFVQYHQFEIWHPAVLLSGLVIVAIGLAVGLPIMIWPASIGFVVCIVLILSFIALQIPNIGISSIVLLFQYNAVAAVFGAVSVLVLVALTWRIRRIVPLVSAAVFGMIVIAVILVPPDRIELGIQYDRDQGGASAAPPIIHIVLDEHIGIEGIPIDIPGGKELKEELKAFYRHYGFRLYGRAFTHWSETQYAIGAILNARMVPDGVIRRSQDPRADYFVTQNRWFDTLSDKGFNIRVYQTDYLDLCLREASRIQSCHVSPANSISLLRGTDLPADLVARVMLESFVESLAIGLGTKLKPKYRLGAIAAPEVLSIITKDLALYPKGTAVFAHLLIPHHSYVYDAVCNLKKNSSQWENSSDRVTIDQPTGSPKSRRERYIFYFEQTRCTYKMLGEFFQNLQKIDLFDNSTIILHGDHGSRIGLLSPAAGGLSEISEADIVAYFSTLYAVKRPGLPPAYDPKMRSIQALFAESFLGRNLVESGPFVFMMGYSPKLDDRPVRAPMPNLSAGGP